MNNGDNFKAMPFLRGSKIETMRQDINRLRQSVRGGDLVDANRAFDDCEKWFDLIRIPQEPVKFTEHEEIEQ